MSDAEAAQKRAYVAKFARQFGDKSKAIMEGPRDNRGPLLQKWLRDNGAWSSSPFVPPNPWCASFVSAMAYWTDKNVSGSLTTKYRNAGSSATGAGVYSNKSVRDAKVGLAVSWQNKPPKGVTGHVGLVIEVLSDGIMVAEGNTNNDNIDAQDRNGGSTAVKKYTWARVLHPSTNTPSRTFRHYAKLWPESNESLGQPSEEYDGEIADAGSNAGGSGGSAQTSSRVSAKSVYLELQGMFSGKVSTDADANDKKVTSTKNIASNPDVKNISSTGIKLDETSINIEATS